MYATASPHSQPARLSSASLSLLLPCMLLSAISKMTELVHSIVVVRLCPMRLQLTLDAAFGRYLILRLPRES